MSAYEYFETPLFVHVNDEGAISLEWCHGKQGDRQNSKRASIYIDAEEKGGDLEVYGILTGPGDKSELVPLKKPEDVVRLLKEYFGS